MAEKDLKDEAAEEVDEFENPEALFISTLVADGVKQENADRLLEEYVALCRQIPKTTHKTSLYMQRKGMIRALAAFGFSETFFKALNRAVTPRKPRAVKAEAVEDDEGGEEEETPAKGKKGKGKGGAKK